jgi:hypothetical protein
VFLWAFGRSHPFGEFDDLPSGYVKIAIEIGALVRGFTHKKSMVELSIVFC